MAPDIYTYDITKCYMPFKDFVAFGKAWAEMSPSRIKTIDDIKQSVKSITTSCNVLVKDKMLKQLLEENPILHILKYEKDDENYIWKVIAEINGIKYLFKIIFDKYYFTDFHLGRLETCFSNYHCFRF